MYVNIQTASEDSIYNFTMKLKIFEYSNSDSIIYLKFKTSAIIIKEISKFNFLKHYLILESRFEALEARIEAKIEQTINKYYTSIRGLSFKCNIE